MVQNFEASKTSKRTDINTTVLSLTRWFLPKRLVAQEDISTLYLFIYLLIRQFLFYLTTVSIVKTISSILKLINK